MQRSNLISPIYGSTIICFPNSPIYSGVDITVAHLAVENVVRRHYYMFYMFRTENNFKYAVENKSSVRSCLLRQQRTRTRCECTAQSYRLGTHISSEGGREEAHGFAPKRYDDGCIRSQCGNSSSSKSLWARDERGRRGPHCLSAQPLVRGEPRAKTRRYLIG